MPTDVNGSLAKRVPKTGMVADAQATVRNASLLLVQWGAQVANGFVFAALVRRLMGPEVYGRYALITSLSLWFVAASTLGLQSVMSRYVWEFAGEVTEESPGRLRRPDAGRGT